MDAKEQKKIDDILCIFNPLKSGQPQVSYSFTHGNYTVEEWGPRELYMQRKVFTEFFRVVEHLEEFANKLHTTRGFDPDTPTIKERDRLAGRFMWWHMYRRPSESQPPVYFVGDDRMPVTLPDLTDIDLFWDVLKYLYMLENHKTGGIVLRPNRVWCHFNNDYWAATKIQVETFLNEHNLINNAQEIAKMV